MIAAIRGPASSLQNAAMSCVQAPRPLIEFSHKLLQIFEPPRCRRKQSAAPIGRARNRTPCQGRSAAAPAAWRDDLAFEFIEQRRAPLLPQCQAFSRAHASFPRIGRLHGIKSGRSLPRSRGAAFFRIDLQASIKPRRACVMQAHEHNSFAPDLVVGAVAVALHGGRRSFPGTASALRPRPI